MNIEESKLNRLEVIGNGRELVYYGKYTISIQDDGKTLKIFLPDDIKLPLLTNQINRLKEVDIENDISTNIQHKPYKTIYTLDKSIFNEESLNYFNNISKLFNQLANKIEYDITNILELNNDEFELYLIYQFIKHQSNNNIKIVDYVVLNKHSDNYNHEYIYVEFELLDFILNRLNDIKPINYQQVTKIRQLIEYKPVDKVLKNNQLEHYIIRSINLKDILDILNNNK